MPERAQNLSFSIGKRSTYVKSGHWRCGLGLIVILISVLINMVSCELQYLRRWTLLWGKFSSKQRSGWMGEIVASEDASAWGIKIGGSSCWKIILLNWLEFRLQYFFFLTLWTIFLQQNILLFFLCQRGDMHRSFLQIVKLLILWASRKFHNLSKTWKH